MVAGKTTETIVGQCTTSNDGGLPVEIKASRSAQGVTVNVMAHTVSGHDRFRNLGVPVYVNGEVYRQRTTATYTGTSTSWFHLNAFNNRTGAPCFPDDNLITGDSVIRVILLPGTGYTINPEMRMVEVTISDDGLDNCSSPDGGDRYQPHPQGGFAWGVCTCSKDGPWYRQRRLVDGNLTYVNRGETGYSENYAAAVRKQNSDTTNYCPESPYKGPS